MPYEARKKFVILIKMVSSMRLLRKSACTTTAGRILEPERSVIVPIYFDDLSAIHWSFRIRSKSSSSHTWPFFPPTMLQVRS